METLILDDSPLGTYLAEGDDYAEKPPTYDIREEAEKSKHLNDTDDDNTRKSLGGRRDAPPACFAPRGIPWLSRVRQRLDRSCQPRRSKLMTRLRDQCGRLVTSTLGGADNARFLEHFRYTLVGSQLLDARRAGGLPPPLVFAEGDVKHGTFGQAVNRETAHPQYYDAGNDSSGNLVGAAASSTLALALVLALDWTRSGPQRGVSVERLVLVVAVAGFAAVLLYGYARRRWLQRLQRRAIEAAAALVTGAQTFEAAGASTLGLVQEVELVSRGYRLSSPLPPISRMEGAVRSRHCERLRRRLAATFLEVAPSVRGAAQRLQPLANTDDLERLLDAYDVRPEDVAEAMLDNMRQSAAENTSDKSTPYNDHESLVSLREQQSRLSTLRRFVLCALLSVPATGRAMDANRWRACCSEMESLCCALDSASDAIAKVINDDDQILRISTGTSPLVGHHMRASSSPMMPSPSASISSHPAVRRISALSTSVRGVQAKLWLLREESARALSVATPLSEPNANTPLRERYDAVGADLRALLQAWEAGGRAFANDLSHSPQDRRVSSRTTSSLGGLTAVGEDDSPIENAAASVCLSPRSTALRRLTGDDPDHSLPATLPITESESEDEGARGASVDEDVFEAVAAPQHHFGPSPSRGPSFTKEQRLAKMREERERQARARERRDVGVNMVRELQAVIKLRPSHRRNTIGGGGVVDGETLAPAPSTPPPSAAIAVL